MDNAFKNVGVSSCGYRLEKVAIDNFASVNDTRTLENFGGTSNDMREVS
jgi:hypothetical protein